MKKKGSPNRRLSILKAEPHVSFLNCRNVPVEDLFLYARSFHTAAKKMAEALEHGSGPFTEFDVSPVVFMYRHALELHLKAFVLGEGGNFLATKPDPISVGKTHSVSWLAQFVCQIITAVKWENEFRCKGVESLADFKVLVEEINSVDPGSYVFTSPVSANVQSIRAFARKMDAVLGLLGATADALAAEWDMRSEAPTEAKPTIH